MPNTHSLARLKSETGSNIVSIVQTWYQNDQNSTEIKPAPAKTNTEEGLRRAIAAARSSGMKVHVFKKLISVVNDFSNNISQLISKQTTSIGVSNVCYSASVREYIILTNSSLPSPPSPPHSPPHHPCYSMPRLPHSSPPLYSRYIAECMDLDDPQSSPI